MSLLKRSGDFQPHPAGIYQGTLANIEQDDSGDYGSRLKFQYDTTAKRDDGQLFRVNFWTSFSLHEKSNLPKVIRAHGFDPSDPYFDSLDSISDLFECLVQSPAVTMVIEATIKADKTPSHKVANILPVGMTAAPAPTSAADGGSAKPGVKPAAAKPSAKPAPVGASVAGETDTWKDE